MGERDDLGRDPTRIAPKGGKNRGAALPKEPQSKRHVAQKLAPRILNNLEQSGTHNQGQPVDESRDSLNADIHG